MDTQENRSGGPQTETGKDNSSQNAIKHGCCTKRVIVKGERPQDFYAVEEWWFSHYEGDGSRPLLEEAALNEWLLHRTQRNYLAVDAQLAESDPNEWTEQQMHRLQLMLRYKTAAERSFHRSLAAVERFRRTRVYESLALGRAEAQKQERRGRDEEEKDAPEEQSNIDRLLALPKREPVVCLTQWVKVSQEGKNTVTTLSPSNEELLAKAQTMDPKPVRVVRNVTIWPWLATEYAWVRDALPGRSNCRQQVMTVEEWLLALEREKAIEGGHIGPVEKDPSWAMVEQQLAGLQA